MAMKDLDPVHARQYSGLTADSFEVTLIEDDSSGELLSLNNYIADEDLMAFDAEWQPESPRTDGVHVLQMAFPSKQRVFVVQLWALKEPHLTCLKTSFQRRARKIVGWGATEDIHRLSNIFRLDWKRKIFDIQPVAGILMKEADAGAGIRGIKLSKDSSVTCSDWSAPRLSSEQVRYAAADAWLTVLLYLRLASLPEALALFERRWGPQGQRTFGEEMQHRQQQAEKDRARLQRQRQLERSRSRSR
ncbi:EXD2 [Symbiodinium microadriaticum]|nr:EXD2 [Symbiodinium microadriaticum]